MEKRSSCEFALPEELIQHIQSFMSGKEAAKTSILSKSWYTAWSTHPNLELDVRFFYGEIGRPIIEERFWEFAKKTIRRYEALNLKIVSFRLWIRDMLRYDHYCREIAEELIVKAMTMGAVDFDLHISHPHKIFTLPREVLGSEKLTRLSVYGCKIDFRADRKACRWKLKSLSLGGIYVEGDIIGDLISNCPLIEKLTLDPYIFQCSADNGIYNGRLGLNNLHELYKLKSLFLGDVNVDNSFFSNISSNFPCLKNLSLDDYNGFKYKAILLSSTSLECISFKQEKHELRANFDVPSLRKFTFVGPKLPSLFFKTTSREWESDISLTSTSCLSPDSTWFLELPELLTNLSSSKVSLSINNEIYVEESTNSQALIKTTVENLTIDSPDSFIMLECLFWYCRPKFVTLRNVNKCSTSRRVIIDDESLHERNVQRVREICLEMSNELEEVTNVEISDEEDFGEWERQPSLQKIHFQLRWGRRREVLFQPLWNHNTDYSFLNKRLKSMDQGYKNPL